jgi:hypothetical protein
MIANFPYQLSNLALKRGAEKALSESEKPPMKGGVALALQPANSSKFLEF